MSEDLEYKRKLYAALKKKSRRTKTFSILMLLLLFTVNAYAWFVYITESRFDLSARVISWDITFLSDTYEVKDVDETINDAVPGMKPYSKTVKIYNNSDFNAKFIYKFNTFKILGKDALPSNASNMSVSEIITYLSERYPFDFSMSSNLNSFSPGQAGSFNINFGWEFEDTNKYYKVTDVYTFNPSFEYYRLRNGSYVLDESITATNYNANMSSLYLYKDDADSFFGMECPAYVSNVSDPCVTYNVLLIVEQLEN